MSVEIISTVITAAKTYDLADLSTVKSDLAITGNDENAYLKRLISRASAAAKNYCNRVFQVETVQDQIWPQRDLYPGVVIGGLRPLQLSRFPIADKGIVSVTENGTALVEGTDFIADYAVGQLTRLSVNGFPRRWHPRAIVVQYNAGFATIPDDVVEAVTLMIKDRRAARTRDSHLRAETVPGVNESQWWITTGSDGAMNPEAAGLLDNYRVPVVA